MYLARLIALLLIFLVGCGSSSMSEQTPAPTPTDPNPSSPKAGAPGEPLPPLPSEAPGLAPLPTFPLVPNDAPPPEMAGYEPSIQANKSGNWQKAETWNLNRVPRTGDIVSIPEGFTVNLAGKTASLAGLWIDGALEFADADVTLISHFIMVHGRFQAGSETQPYARNATVTLTGDSGVNVSGMGSKVLGVGAGGLLKLHGEQRLAWSQLANDASAGAMRLTLADNASTWRPGDDLIIAASGFDPREAEVVKVTAVNGNEVFFEPALKYSHLGLVQTYNSKVLDQRAAVGLLTRNIRVQGDEASTANHMGGHIMVMRGGHAQVSGVQLERMGQRGHAGRYPMHWHLAGDREGNYLINSAIRNSFQRAAVLHSTHNVRLEGNVAYDIPNHAFVWAEDGDESGNILVRNLGVLGRNPASEHFAFKISNPFHGNSSQAEQRSALFWGRSLDRHVIRENIAAGALEGSGFFVDQFSPAPANVADSGMVFDGNTAHSVKKILSTGNQINYPEATNGHGLMVTTGTSGEYKHFYTNFTSYHNVSGVWLEDRASHLKDSVIADNSKVGVLVLRGVVEDVTVVGDSANPIPLESSQASINISASAGIQVAGSSHGGERAPAIRSATIIDHAGIGLLWDQENIFPETEIGQVNYINTPRRFWITDPRRQSNLDPAPTYGMDVPADSIVGGASASRVMMENTGLANERCRELTEMQAYACNLSDSFLIRSSESVILIEESGRITYLRSLSYKDDSLPNSSSFSFAANRGRFRVRLEEPLESLELSLERAAGQSAEFSFGSGAPTDLRQNGKPLAKASSLLEVRESEASAYFYDEAERWLYLKVVGASHSETVSIQAPLEVDTSAGRPADALPSGAQAGFSYSVFPNAVASQQLRYGPLSGTSSRSGEIDAARIDEASAATVLDPNLSGDGAVLRGFVHAPEDGIYRMSLWGSGGGTSLFIGNTWVAGQPSAFINGNYVDNGQLTDKVVPIQPSGMVALKEGWHPFTVVHARLPQSTGGSSLYMRWATPSLPSTWVYPEIRRAP